MKSAHDVGRSNLIEQIYDSTIDHDLWPATLDRIGQLAGGEITMLFVFDLRKRIIHRQLSTAFPALDEYISYYSLIDPRNEFGLAQPQGATFVDASFITPAGIGRSEFYQDYLLPNRMGHVGAQVIERRADVLIGLAIQRPFRAQPFALPELDVLQSLAPHLGRALRLQLTLERRAGDTPPWSLAMLDSLRWPVFLLDGHGRLYLANTQASRALSAADGFTCAHGRLSGEHPWDTHLLQRAIARALAGAGSRLCVQRGNGQPPYVVSVTPLAHAARGKLNDEAPRVAIHALDPSITVPDAAPILAASFALSPAEARLAAALLDGDPLPAVARRLGISPHTARTQLAQLFAKTGTNRQSQLIGLLRSCISLPGQARHGEP
ncbi:MAG: helix-turn-helix transcriptional regulator [Geminicoccaceae bacterium]